MNQGEKKQSVTVNYIYNMAYQLIVLILPLITTPYVSRVLGPDGVGMYGLTYSISQYFVLFGCIGLNLYGQREIAYHQNQRDERSKVFFELLMIRTAAMLLSISVFVFTVCRDDKYGLLYRIEILELIAALIDITWFFQGLEDFKKIVIRNCVVKLGGVALIFLFVRTSSDTPVYTLILSMTVLLGNFSMWLYLPRYLQRVPVGSLNIAKHIYPALMLFIPQIATSVYNVLDKSMIGMITGVDAEVAFYEQAQKIIKMALSVPLALGTVMLPRMTSMYGEGDYEGIKGYIRRSMRFVCMLSFPLCAGVVGISKDFVPWFFGPGFDKVIGNLLVISPVIVLVGVSNVIGVQYLLPTNRQNDYTKSVVIGTGVNFICNMLLIPGFLSVGAAVGSVIAEFSVTLVQLFIVRKEFSLKSMLRDVYKYFFGAMLMLLCIVLYSYYVASPRLIHTMIEIMIGVLIYGVFLIAVRDSFVLSFWNKVKRLVKKA